MSKRKRSGGRIGQRVTTALAFCLGLWYCGMSVAQSAPRNPGPHPASQQLENPFKADGTSAKRGHQIYRNLCVSCHALNGTGESDVVEALAVKPGNFTNGEWKYGSTDGEIFSVIRDGTSDGMQPFDSKLSTDRIWHVINYLRTFEDSGDGNGETAEAEVPENPIPVTDESLRKGKQLYARFCVKCHGRNGLGDTEMREFLSTPPSDITDGVWNYGGRDGDIFSVIKNGTQYDMTAFANQLSDERIWHVVNYLRSMGSKS